MLKVKDKKLGAQIRDAELELSSNNHTWYSHQVKLLDNSSLLGMKLDQIPTDVYELIFTVQADEYLKQWYNNYPSATTIRAKIKLTVVEDLCIANLGEIRKLTRPVLSHEPLHPG